ncbi:hypothetical protein BGX28_006792 [Mortierella sp. GBA30]|nr:hypothetical protein BGX28_006792 [Mortierella sp. GBA30]
MDSGCDTFDSRVVSDEEPEDPPFDVHFYHCELHTRRSRIIGAHREILSAHPKLKQMVAIAETGRRKLIETMQQDVLLAAPGRLQTPVVVDISCLSYPAFRAVVCYIYTSDIHLALAHVTYASVNSSVTPLSEHLFTHAATNDQPSMDVFMLRDLVHLSLMFNLEDLLRAFAQMILPSLSVDNALHIFFHFGGETAEIKERAMAFVFDNFQTIFGRYAKNAGLFEDFFDKEYTGDGSLMNKVDLEISENGEKTRTLTKSSSCNIASMESHKVVEMSKGLDELSVLSDKWPYRLQNEVTANSERDRPLLDRNIDLPGDSYQEVVASDDSSTPSIDCIDLRACSLQKERNANDQPDRTLIDNSDIESCNVRMDVDVGGPYETSVNNGRQVCLLKDEVKTSPDSSDLVSVRIRKDDDESSESDKPSVEADIRSFSSPNERIGYEKLDTSWDYSQLRLCNLA